MSPQYIFNKFSSFDSFAIKWIVLDILGSVDKVAVLGISDVNFDFDIVIGCLSSLMPHIAHNHSRIYLEVYIFKALSNFGYHVRFLFFI